MYIVLAVSSEHIYDVMASTRANTAEVFMYFLDCLLKFREDKLNMSNLKTVFVVDNASIHKTKEINEYVRNNKISILTIPPYSLALNGAETIIQALKLKIKCQRGNGK